MNKVTATAAALLGVFAISGADAPKLQLISGLKDVSIYTKTKYDLFRQWDQEFGVLATVAKYGNAAATPYAAYDPIYPISFDKRPRWSSGLTLVYYFQPKPIRLGIYTKPKYDFVRTWKQETGGKRPVLLEPYSQCHGNSRLSVDLSIYRRKKAGVFVHPSGFVPARPIIPVCICQSRFGS